MDIKPWQITTLVIAIALIAFVLWVVRAFKNGRRG